MVLWTVTVVHHSSLICQRPVYDDQRTFTPLPQSRRPVRVEVVTASVYCRDRPCENRAFARCGDTAVSHFWER